MTLKLCVMIRWGNGDCACIEEMNISISSNSFHGCYIVLVLVALAFLSHLMQ